jgi:hypothetical protein
VIPTAIFGNRSRPETKKNAFVAAVQPQRRFGKSVVDSRSEVKAALA